MRHYWPFWLWLAACVLSAIGLGTAGLVTEVPRWVGAVVFFVLCLPGPICAALLFDALFWRPTKPRRTP